MSWLSLLKAIRWLKVILHDLGVSPNFSDEKLVTELLDEVGASSATQPIATTLRNFLKVLKFPLYRIC
jgi:hypothetical protein